MLIALFFVLVCFFVAGVGCGVCGVTLGDQVLGVFDKLDGWQHPHENKNSDMRGPATHAINIWHRPQMVKEAKGQALWRENWCSKMF